MARSLKDRFRGIEAAVIRTAKVYGAVEAMHIYGIKHIESFEKWWRENTDEPLPKNPLEGFKGGEQHLFFLDTKEAIKKYIDRFGMDWVTATFHTTKDTVTKILNSNGGARGSSMDSEDFVTSREHAEDIRELRLHLQKLEEHHNRLVVGLGLNLELAIEHYSVEVESLIQQGRTYQLRGNHE